MQEFIFSECNSLYFPNAFQPILLILRIPRPYLESCERVHYNSLLASFNNRGTEGTLAESDSNSREQNRLSVPRPKEIICCQIHKNICCLISANTLKCIISSFILKSVLKSLKCYGTVFEQILNSKKSLSMFEQILNAELAGIWTKVELDLTFPLQ